MPGVRFGNMEYKGNSGRNRVYDRGELECFRNQLEFLGADSFHVHGCSFFCVWLFEVEVLIGFLAGAITFIIYYKDHLEKEKRLKKLVRILKDMEMAVDEIARNDIKDLKNDLKAVAADVTSIKITLAVQKVRIAMITGIFSTAGGVLAAILLKFVFKI